MWCVVLERVVIPVPRKIDKKNENNHCKINNKSMHTVVNFKMQIINAGSVVNSSRFETSSFIMFVGERVSCKRKC